MAVSEIESATMDDGSSSLSSSAAGQNSSSGISSPRTPSGTDGTGRAASGLSEADDKAKDLARQAKEQAKQKLADAGEQAANAAEPLKEEARDFAETKKRQGADRIGEVAKAVHNAADEVGKEVPKAARYIHAGARRLDGASDMLRNRSLDQLLNDANRRAHDRPLTFLAGSVAAGFLLARFLRTSAGQGGAS